MNLARAGALLFFAMGGSSLSQGQRPPAVPLVTHDPYFSVWSTADRLTDDATRHWTGAEHSLTSLIRIDGRSFRLMGREPAGIPALPSLGIQVLPTRTIYTFSGEGMKVRLTFTTPTIPTNIDVLSRPATYLTWDAVSLDGRAHDASVYFDASSQLAVNSPAQRVTWSTSQTNTLNVARMGSVEQPVLQRSGDNLRIEWGYLYLAAPRAGSSIATGSRAELLESYVKLGKLPLTNDVQKPREVRDRMPVSAALLPLGRVGAKTVSKHITLAYDDEWSIMYFNRMLRPYWRRNGANANTLLRVAERDYASLQKSCAAFDAEFMADLTRAGGAKYAYLGALAYRQSFAAQKVVADANGQPLMFSKENFSNGCIGTVDVLYPAAPALLLLSPSLMKASLRPILDYAASPRWKFPFAPHDLGTYPLANGQVYGGGERTEDNQMPVEESGNMLILLAALAQVEGNANFSAPYWPQLRKWAEYLATKGFDPESQLSTDDFAGHLAHNVNLSAKAIEALAAYAKLCNYQGLRPEAKKYQDMAKAFAARWVQEAEDGDHYRLAFDKPGTWSQKYNLVWDKLLGLNVFPGSVIRKESDYYLRKQNRYGLPLDNRRDYTKLDWVVWTATMAGNPRDFETLIAPAYDFFNDTPDRVPMTDWYHTLAPRKSGFQARSVVGGVFIKMLDDPKIWRKYASRDKNRPRNWASLPPRPIVTQIVPTSESAGIEWSYTLERPREGWMLPAFDASSWQRGVGGFGSRGTPGAAVRTNWTSQDIWLRREFVLPAGRTDDLHLFVHHDEDAEVYINGVLAARLSSYRTKYEPVPISAAARATLRPGRNLFAVHCHQTAGGQYIDVGLVRVLLPKG
jgi:hypothetical protein